MNIQLIECLSYFEQDKANKNGGKWIVRLKKGLASRCWENLVSGLCFVTVLTASNILF